VNCVHSYGRIKGFASDKMCYIAHTENDSREVHYLRDHLRAVGSLARKFGELANPALGEASEWAGLLHDLGKYRDEFQQYLLGQRESSVETRHAIYGAALAFCRRCLGPTLAIAGHHAGLDNWHHLREELRADTKHHTKDQLPLIVGRFETDLFRITEEVREPEFIRNNHLAAEFYIRMLFSSLVDADFLDTEAHYSRASRSAHQLEPEELLRRVIADKETKSRDGQLNALRNQIFQQCLHAAPLEQGFFSLTVPTGGGKTLSAMAFALKHAQAHNLSRVIVVIPYLSIIEQNAAQYRRILDPANKGIVIENHSAVAPPDDTNEERPRAPFEKHASEYAAENWDAPVVITTSVQFIESLFANRTSRCRKLHNIARSLVIFDEVQTLPSHILTPLLSALRELRDRYGVSFVFSTATQPAFRRRPRHLEEGFDPGEVREITEDTAAAFKTLQRVKYRLPRLGETVGWPELAERLSLAKQVLCVVNVRRHAFELWQELRRRVPGEADSVFHLSSAMCAQHRFDLLGDDREPRPGTIRHRLRNGFPCRLVSTQLIEAGVDVDFPAAYRALGPLDSIVQVAGRCNREGNLTNSAGQPTFGEVIVFVPAEHNLPPGVYRKATDITAALLTRVNSDDLAQNHDLFADYFDQLYQLTDTDRDQIQADRRELKFRDVAANAQVIKDETKPVIVRYGKAENMIDELRSRPARKGQPRFSRNDMRRLQRYMVSLRLPQFKQIEALKQIEPLLPNLDLHVLPAGMYHENLGLIINETPLEDLIL